MSMRAAKNHKSAHVRQPAPTTDRKSKHITCISLRHQTFNLPLCMSKMTCVTPSTAEARMCTTEGLQKIAKPRKRANKRPPKTAKASILHVFLIDIKLSKHTCACAKQHEHCQ
jgi:hypothetical protein